MIIILNRSINQFEKNKENVLWNRLYTTILKKTKMNKNALFFEFLFLINFYLESI